MAKVYGDRWEIVKSLDEGGQAHTFLVHDMREADQTLYVLKRLKNLARLDRFRREIEAIRTLSHGNIVRLIDFDLEVEKPFLVTEYCRGGSLAQAVPFWRDSPIKGLDLFLEICNGIHYAHSREPHIIHRDLKPANIFLRTEMGPAVVGDFGICWMDQDGTRITLTDEAAGPWMYMAPEVEGGRADRVSVKCDVYSLGKLLYWLLTGKVFPRESFRDRIWDLKEWVPSRRSWKNIYMEHVNRLLDHMVVADPEKRWYMEQVIILAEEAINLVSKEYVPIAKDILAPCRFCGQGFYRYQDTEHANGVSNFGLRPVGANQWRILVCDACGHVEFFRIDLASRKEWWG